MEKILNENEVLIGEKVYQVKMAKMKYIKTGFYNTYLLMKTHGLLKIFKFSDGEKVLANFLTAIFDSEEIAKEAMENLDIKSMKELLDITKKINEIEDELPKNVMTPQE